METYKVKKIGNIEYYVGKFESADGDIQYGVHARYIDTSKIVLEGVYAGLFDTVEQAEDAFLKLIERIAP